MDGIEIIDRIQQVKEFIKLGDEEKAILYLNYIIEDVEMYKKNSL